MRITQEAALSLAVDAARAEATKRGLNESGALTLEGEGQDIIRSLFAALGDISPGPRTEGVHEWHHRELREADADWRNLGINRAYLVSSAENYVNKPWLSRPALDWFVVDLLMYAEWIAFYISVRAQSLGVIRTASHLTEGVAARVFDWIWELGKLGIWVWITVVLYRQNLWFAVAWVGYAAIMRYVRWRRMQPAGAILSEMFKCYITTTSETFSWSVVWEELRRTRELGAVWDGVLYRLVESRKIGRPLAE